MLSRFAELMIFGLTPFVFGGLLIPDAVAEERRVAGSATYLQRIALPPDAELAVRIEETSLGGQPGAVVAETKVTPAPGQMPIPFELTFDSAAVQPKTTYSLQARITVDNELWFVSDEASAIDPLSPGRLDLTLKMVRGN